MGCYYTDGVLLYGMGCYYTGWGVSVCVGVLVYRIGFVYRMGC